MRLVGYLLAACVALAIIRAVALALVITLMLAFVVGVLARPRETFGLMLLMFVGGMIQSYPVLCLAVVGIAAIVSALAKNRERPS